MSAIPRERVTDGSSGVGKDRGSEDARDSHDPIRLYRDKNPMSISRMIGRWDENATMGDTKATRAGATAAAPCTGRPYFPLCFVLSFQKNSSVRRSVIASEFFIREFHSASHVAAPFTLVGFYKRLDYRNHFFLYLFCIYHGQHWTFMAYPELHLGIAMVACARIVRSSTCAAILLWRRSVLDRCLVVVDDIRDQRVILLRHLWLSLP